MAYLSYEEIEKQAEEVKQLLLKNERVDGTDIGMPRDLIDLMLKYPGKFDPMALSMGYNNAVDERKYITKQIVVSSEDGSDSYVSIHNVMYRKNFSPLWRLDLTIDGYYSVWVNYFPDNRGDGKPFYTVFSGGETDTESAICHSREEMLDTVMKTYGAPHCEEFKELVNTLLFDPTRDEE